MYINDDYIGLDGDNWSFYYGYEVLNCTECGNIGDEVNEDEICCEEHEHEWCFTFTLDTGITQSVQTIPHSKLDTRDMFDMTGNLGAGMKIALNEMVGNIQRMVKEAAK